MDISLDRAINGFKLQNEAEGLSPRTIRWYDRNLRSFHTWLQDQRGYEVKMEEIKAVDIRAYLNGLRTENNIYANHPFKKKVAKSASPRTVQAYFSSISAFFNWAVREELISDSPAKNIPRPKVPKYIPDPFDTDEIQRLFQAVKQYNEAKANRITAMLLILLDAGLRVSELLNIKVSDIDFDRGRAKVMGKGAKERYVFFGKKTKRAIWRYVSLSRPEPIPNVNNLFLTHDGRPIPSRRFAHMLSELGNLAKVDNVHPHRFRRSASLLFLRNGGDIFSLQKILGHESLDMVKRYVDWASDDTEQSHHRASPVDNLKL